MSVIFLLIPLSIALAAVFLAAFIWAVRSGQFEDTRTPALRLLWEEAGPSPAAKRNGPGATKGSDASESGGQQTRRGAQREQSREEI